MIYDIGLFFGTVWIYGSNNMINKSFSAAQEDCEVIHLQVNILNTERATSQTGFSDGHGCHGWSFLYSWCDSCVTDFELRPTKFSPVRAGLITFHMCWPPFDNFLWHSFKTAKDNIFDILLSILYH